MNEMLSQKIAELPKKSGVYIMLDKNSDIIYIGKAKVLASRVSQYFNASPKPDKVMAMVGNVCDFTYIITNSERDALALEATLIHKHKPHYNILLKDDKHHPYIRIDLRKPYPALEIVRRCKHDGAKYFGPYFGGIRIKELIELIKSVYLVRACAGNTWNKNHRVCLNYHIGLCSGACAGYITKEEYRNQLDKAIAFLEGNDADIAKILTEKMTLAAGEERFEHAMVYRDRLKNLEKLNEKILTSFPRDSNFDVFGYATNNLHSCICVLIVRAGVTVALENFSITDSSFNEAECIAEFLTQYYDGTRALPQEIIVQTEPQDSAQISEYIGEKYKRKANIFCPKIATKKQLLDNCIINAEDYLKRSVDTITRKDEMTFGAVKQLRDYVGLKRAPKRIECYDISNISGVDKVASMVVFIDGAPVKSLYRRFKIRTVEGADDYKSMNEVLGRRIAHFGESDFGDKPDLIVVDGGKGQLSSAYKAAVESGVNIEMIALAERNEEVFRINESEPIIIPKTSYALKLLQRIRDEAHRFAITYHRNLRSNRYLSSLEEIKGIGKERRTRLLTHFKSIEKIKNATIDELCEVDGINKKTAEIIKKHFDGERE